MNKRKWPTSTSCVEMKRI